ncbi:hypothetical protein ACIRCZ_19995 [Leifsonia sp. NPDC102414]|uniref:hypothetical protein n=1 Tax=Leifsonia sp. NPDC102414 TaxID=3364124 RepID=UPI0037F81A15
MAIEDSRYLVGPWGRRLAVELSETEVTIRSSGYHSGRFHVVTYARSWATGVRHTLPLSHTVTGTEGSREETVTMARHGEVPEAEIVQTSNRASQVDGDLRVRSVLLVVLFLASPRPGRVRRRH